MYSLYLYYIKVIKMGKHHWGDRSQNFLRAILSARTHISATPPLTPFAVLLDTPSENSEFLSKKLWPRAANSWWQGRWMRIRSKK